MVINIVDLTGSRVTLGDKSVGRAVRDDLDWGDFITLCFQTMGQCDYLPQASPPRGSLPL